MDIFYLKYILIIAAFIWSGFALKKYIKNHGVDEIMVFGVSGYWLKLMAKSLIVFGFICLALYLFTFYYYLKNNGFV